MSALGCAIALAFAAAPEAALQAAGDAARGPMRLAVYELRAEGIEPRMTRVVGEALVAELRKLQRTSVISMDEVRAMLDFEAEKQLMGCSDESCVSEIAEALGVDGVILATIADVNGKRIFGLRHIDQRAAKVLAQTSKHLEIAGGEEVLAAIGPSVQELFPDVPLRAGVERGVPKELGLRLNPPPLSPVVFWSVAATGAALAATSAAATAVNVVTFEGLRADFERSATTGEALSGAAVKDASARTDTALVVALATAGGALAAATGAGVAALFTDWHGYADEAP